MMNQVPIIQVKFRGAPGLIEELRYEADEEDVEIISVGTERDPTYLHFGIAEVASLVAIIQGAYWVGDLARKIHRLLKKNKDKKEEQNRRLSVQTPFGQWEFVSDDALTEEDVRQVLIQLSGSAK